VAPQGRGNCAIDYAFHQIIGGVDDRVAEGMTYLVEHEGITSFKLFMAYPGVFYSDDGQILRAMQTAADCGAMIMMHAENGIAIDVLVQQALARARPTPKYHSYTRPSPLEAEATHRAIVLSHVAGNVPLYIVHMSAGDALNEVAAARHHGRNVFAETCPQYLWLTARGDARPARLRGLEVGVLTPVRRRTTTPHYIGQMGHGHQGDLWKGLRMNELASCQHRPLPVLLQGPEGARPRRLLEDPQRHRRRRAPHGADLPGRGRRRDQPRALGRDLLHHPGAHVRHVPEEGRHRPRRRRRRRGLGPEHEDQDRHQRQAPHEHGPLGLGGLGDRRQGRHRPQPRQPSSSRTTQYVGRKGHGQFVKRGLSQYLV
jgi:hypothetical protein